MPEADYFCHQFFSYRGGATGAKAEAEAEMPSATKILRENILFACSLCFEVFLITSLYEKTRTNSIGQVRA
jgi:hypothetical protein